MNYKVGRIISYKLMKKGKIKKYENTQRESEIVVIKIDTAPFIKFTFVIFYIYFIV